MELFISLASILITPFPTDAVRTMSTNCWVSEVAELWLFATHCFTSLVQDSFSGKKQELKQEVHLKVRHLHETNALTYSPQTIPAASWSSQEHGQFPIMMSKILPSWHVCSSVGTCTHPLAAEGFRNRSINCCWEQKVSQCTPCSNWKWRCLFFSIAKIHLTTHIINNSFASGLHHKVSGSFPAWQQLERWRCPGLCVLVLCVQTDESTHFLFCKSKGTPKMGSAPKFGKLFLVAITVGKKLRLIQKNKHFYKSDCVQG